MDAGMIIGSSVAIVIMVGTYIVYFKVKDRKESLVIWQDGDTMRLLLSDDEYCEFDISDIKDDKKE